MLAKIDSAAILGMEGYHVCVEVDTLKGMPAFDIVGLPDSAVKESRDRVRTAIRNAGYDFPAGRITVNLAPADIRKEGPSFDLPIAVGVLVCMEVLRPEEVAGICFAGELSLDGVVRPINGALSIATAARTAGLTTLCLPAANAPEAALINGVTVLPIEFLTDIVRHVKTDNKLRPTLPPRPKARSSNGMDFSDVKGQFHVKRALEVAAAGRHNVIILGPPGTGKTMLAKRMPGILPKLTTEESLTTTKIHSIVGLLDRRDALLTERPFRAPHHTASYASLAGGGRVPLPGEISLAHNGVLFLDELPEFQKKALEVLRQPMEEGEITISRAGGTLTYPSGFMLLAAMNPCPCGYYGVGDRCTCTENDIERYLRKVSGPLLDRIDIQIEAQAVEYSALDSAPGASVASNETSAAIRKRVEAAHKIQQERFGSAQTIPKTSSNALIPAGQIEEFCKLEPPAKELLKNAFDRLGLSARGYHKILKIARTIADLDHAKIINAIHISEALSYRSLDRKYW